VSAFLALQRVLPFGFGGRRALLLIERNLFIYRNSWLMIVSGFFEPLF
jgi:lipooligosaccharide transport system permease protein